MLGLIQGSRGSRQGRHNGGCVSKMLSHMEVDRKQRAWAETGSRMTFKGLPHMAYFLQWNRLPFRGSRTSLAGGQDSNRFYGRHFLLKPQYPFCSHLGSVFTHKAKLGALHIASSREKQGSFPPWNLTNSLSPV